MKVRKFGSILINGEVIRPGDDALTGLLDTKKSFRPVLEPLMAVPENWGPLLGKRIVAFGSGWERASGILKKCSDYDLVLETVSPLPDACTWAVPAGKQIIVDRASVSWLRKN